MQAPKEIIQNKYWQHLTTAHWTCSTAAAVCVGHEHRNNLYTFFNSSSLCSFVIYLFIYLSNHVHACFSWSFVFTCMVFKIILTFFWQTEPCRLPTTNLFCGSFMNPQKGPPQTPLLSIWIVVQRTLLPPIWKHSKN